MNLGVILPLKQDSPAPGFFPAFLLPKLRFTPDPVVTNRVELHENVNLIVCGIPAAEAKDMHQGRGRSRVRRKLDRIFSDEGVLSVLEHPGLQSIYGSDKARYDRYVADIAIGRLPELAGMVHACSNASRMEIAVTGGPPYLEYAISRLINSYKCINILIPKGHEEPGEAEAAFCETGIPVHITDDPEVLERTRLWIRFPGDHEGFDILPGVYSGRIIDLGDLKVIDTRMKRVYNICLELPGDCARKLGCPPEEFGSSRLPGFIAACCSNAWQKSASDVSLRLGMKLSLKP